MQFLGFNQSQGSSLTFSALGGRGKEKNLFKPAEKIGLSSEGGLAGGFKGGECRTARAEVPPPARERKAKQKILLFLLEEFFGGARKVKM